MKRQEPAQSLKLKHYLADLAIIAKTDPANARGSECKGEVSDKGSELRLPRGGG